MGHNRLDITSFHRWALGDLAGNTNRAIYAEWLVGQALNTIQDTDTRAEWDWYDLTYDGLTIEVKASGFSQTWAPKRRSTPRYDIAPRKQAWDAQTDQTQKFDPPARPADVYVFCLHEALPATLENVQDPECWKFWVISTRRIDAELGTQKSVGESTLNSLSERVGWAEIPAALARAIHPN